MFWLCFTDVSLNLCDVSQCCSDSLVMCQGVCVKMSLACAGDVLVIFQ